MKCKFCTFRLDFRPLLLKICYINCKGRSESSVWSSSKTTYLYLYYWYLDQSIFLRSTLIQPRFLQTRIFCIVRENPDMSGMDRVRKALVEYGVLSPNPSSSSDELNKLDVQFRNRVTAIKGGFCWTISEMINILKVAKGGMKTI